VLVETFQQHHPHVRQPVGIDGCERHGIGIGRLGPGGIVQPRRKQPQWFVGGCEITNR
jgi:hypothetical protein